MRQKASSIGNKTTVTGLASFWRTLHTLIKFLNFLSTAYQQSLLLILAFLVIKAALALARSLLGISFVLCCVVVVLSAVHREIASNP